MDIHKPKAAHSWREFLIEIGTIICGILIALGLEQVVEHFRWEKAVEEARTAIHEELSYNAGYFQNRARVAACVERKLDQIEQALSEAETSGRSRVLPDVPSGLSSQVSDAQWQAARAAQTLAHFPHDELGRIGRYYDTLETFKTNFMAHEDDDWRWLSDMRTGPHRYSTSDLALLRFHLRGARWNNRVITGVGKRMMAVGEPFGIKPTPRPEDGKWEKLCGDAAR